MRVFFVVVTKRRILRDTHLPIGDIDAQINITEGATADLPHQTVFATDYELDLRGRHNGRHSHNLVNVLARTTLGFVEILSDRCTESEVAAAVRQDIFGSITGSRNAPTFLSISPTRLIVAV